MKNVTCWCFLLCFNQYWGTGSQLVTTQPFKHHNSHVFVGLYPGAAIH